MLKLKLCVVTILLVLGSSIAAGDVEKAANDGFQLKYVKEIDVPAAEAFKQFVNQISKWWDGTHSFSGDAANMSIDLQEGCFLERLPNDGFVRHLEIAFVVPGKSICFKGGLGPLLPMGVHGAMMVQFEDSGETSKLTVVYNVSGSSVQNLDKLAPAVNGVIVQQFDRFVDFCRNGAD